MSLCILSVYYPSSLPHAMQTLKVCVYQILVLSVLLYAPETWTSLASDMKTIESSHEVSAKDPWNQVA